MVGSWSPNTRRVVVATAKRVELQPPLATSNFVDSHLGQSRARGEWEANIRPTMEAQPMIKARFARRAYWVRAPRMREGSRAEGQRNPPSWAPQLLNTFVGHSALQVLTMILPQAVSHPHCQNLNILPNHSIGRSDRRALVPSCVGSLVHWCHGDMVTWCHGATVPWCLSAMVPWCFGAMVPWCLGGMVTWYYGATVPWCYGAMDPWCLGAMVPWCYSALEPWCYGALVLWCYGSMVPWCLDSLVPSFCGALVPQCHGALVPWFHGSMVTWYLGSMVPRCHGATVP
ncbi:hypothetical protein CQW23_32058 [Capsicum baccatum]|uniref:Uncharacterized protein n=1 Tax=Capsicum baccatum TaxID=33114 RepID=A0A2G2V5T7_CAPBA|nr:hypothetical protein CQW23_32058 [Capsicum baccatum]